MEKILRRYWLEEVNEVIDKHIDYHEKMINESCLLHELATMLSVEDTDKYKQDINDSACAIASLKMLRNELNGEVEY